MTIETKVSRSSRPRPSHSVIPASGHATLRNIISRCDKCNTTFHLCGRLRMLDLRGISFQLRWVIAVPENTHSSWHTTVNLREFSRCVIHPLHPTAFRHSFDRQRARRLVPAAITPIPTTLWAYGAGMLTVLSNRIGDVALLMVIAWIINIGSWSFIYCLEFLSGSVEIELNSFLIVLAALARSAQIPFSSWLHAALVHSSTLVTAGVYLLVRFSPSFSYWLNVILLLVSGLTIFMAGHGANFEFDLRRFIALTTFRQLDLMIIIPVKTRFSAPFQNGPGTEPAFCTMVTASRSRG